MTPRDHISKGGPRNVPPLNISGAWKGKVPFREVRVPDDDVYLYKLQTSDDDDDNVYLYKLQTKVFKNLHMFPYRPARKA
jgi:hypothetical protein